MNELRALYKEMWRALIAKDIATLERLHAAEFVLIHMTGLHQPREEYFRCVRDGVLNYYSETTENLIVDAADDKGTLTGQSRVEAAVFGGGRNVWRLQLKFQVERRDGQWLLVKAQASTY